MCHCFRVSKKRMLRRGMSRFVNEVFCLEVPKSFVGEHFCALCKKTSGNEKVYG